MRYDIRVVTCHISLLVAGGVGGGDYEGGSMNVVFYKSLNPK